MGTGLNRIWQQLHTNSVGASTNPAMLTRTQWADLKMVCDQHVFVHKQQQTNKSNCRWQQNLNYFNKLIHVKYI